jgi:hypothetical protein
VTRGRHILCIADGGSVAKLADKAENALNETRMLVLGAQVLVGFNFQSTFQPGFEKLPADAQHLKLLGLGLMLLAVGLLLAPCAFHQIVERGNDSHRLIAFTGRIAAFALLPFAFGIGIELYIASVIALGPLFAVPLGLVGLVFALFFWYGLERWRKRHEGHTERAMTGAQIDEVHQTPLHTRIEQMLTEARVVLPGAQALLGFQLAIVVTEAFETLPTASKLAHAAALALIALTVILLMAPAAYHRIVYAGEDTEAFHRVGSRFVMSATVPLALGLAADVYVVIAKIGESAAAGLIAAGSALALLLGLWHVFPILARRRARRRLRDRGGWSAA